MGERVVTEPVSERPSPATDAPIPTEPLISKRTRKATAIVSAIVVVVVVAALVGLGYLMYKAYDWAPTGVTPATVRLRDIAFIVIALETLVLMVLVLIAIVLLLVVIVLIYDRVIPVLEQLNRTINTVADTVHTVQGTTTFVSDKVVSPFIEVSSYAAGVARIFRGVRDLWPGGNKASSEQESPAPEE
jgi:hypothetical protein